MTKLLMDMPVREHHRGIMSDASRTMNRPETTAPIGDTDTSRESTTPRYVMALVIAWSALEPQRVGEVALLADRGQRLILGRGAPDEDGPAHWVRFGRQRPAGYTIGPVLAGPGISREQLVLRAYSDKRVILIEQIGRCPVLVNASPVDKEAVLLPGDTLLLKGQVLFYCAYRPLELPKLQHFPFADLGPFGEADRHGIVGESAVSWQLREELAFHSALDEHVLVLGASGTGKELAARAIHALSKRTAREPFVSCSAKNLPSELIEAELFGNLKNYPNPGTPARKGLVGEAENGTLFMDEIGEIEHATQAHLLRLLDSGGEYHRLGDAQVQRANVRVVAATNRDPSELKHDLAARLKLRLTTPTLNARREDIPLLVRRQLRELAQKTPSIGRRFVDEHNEPRLDPGVVDALLRREYTTGVRELERLVLGALAASNGNQVSLTDELRAGVISASQPARVMSPEEVEASLVRHGHNVTRAAKDLGVSRFAIHRLLKKQRGNAK